MMYNIRASPIQWPKHPIAGSFPCESVNRNEVNIKQYTTESKSKHIYTCIYILSLHTYLLTTPTTRGDNVCTRSHQKQCWSYL